MNRKRQKLEYTSKRNKNRKHYMCRDVETLVNKYILKDQDEDE